jgi:hypothetical protein
MQNKANFQKTKNEYNYLYNKVLCEKTRAFDNEKTKPNKPKSNPIYSVFIRVHSWLNSKRTQSNPTCGEQGRTIYGELVEPTKPIKPNLSRRSLGEGGFLPATSSGGFILT